ncbi:MAG: hypothetical protein ABSB67_04570 [Bryobacteraceae bacterium]
MTLDAAVQLRTATLDDTEAIRQLHERNGLGVLDSVSWRGLWDGYPFASEYRDIAIGWVLEAGDGSLVGALGNVHMLYDLDGRALKGVIATAWAVDRDYRGRSLQLMTAFLKQGGIDLWLNGSANPTASRVMEAMKLSRIPVAGYDVPCFWAASPRRFAKAAMTRKSVPGAGVLSWPAGMVLGTQDIVRRSGRGRITSAVSRIDSFDDRFDSFWLRLRKGPSRLRAVRTRAALEWRFGAQHRAAQARIIVARDGASLSGYAVLLRRQSPELGMELYDIADLQALRDDPAIARDLLLASIGVAREEKVDAVKIMTGAPFRRRAVDELKPYTYRLPFWQLFYKAESVELQSALANADAWDFSLFDTF